MKRTFYHFIQTIADPIKQDDKTAFANLVVSDVAFPKQSTTYHTIANYIELTDKYYQFVSVFDELWDMYDNQNYC